MNFFIYNPIHIFTLTILSLLFIISFLTNFYEKHKRLFGNKRSNIKDFILFFKVYWKEIIINISIILILSVTLKYKGKEFIMSLVSGNTPVLKYLLVSLLICHPISYIYNITKKCVYKYFNLTKEKLTIYDFYLFNKNVVNSINIKRVSIIFIMAALLFTEDFSWIIYSLAIIYGYFLWFIGSAPIIHLDSDDEDDGAPAFWYDPVLRMRNEIFGMLNRDIFTQTDFKKANNELLKYMVDRSRRAPLFTNRFDTLIINFNDAFQRAHNIACPNMLTNTEIVSNPEVLTLYYVHPYYDMLILINIKREEGGNDFTNLETVKSKTFAQGSGVVQRIAADNRRIVIVNLGLLE